MRFAPATLALVVGLALAACDDPVPPTSPPTRSPSASAAALNPDYVAFRGRLQAAPRQFVRFVRDLALDAAAGPGAVGVTAAGMRAWVIAERQAVSGFDPNACFGDALQLYLAALLRTEEAAREFESLAALASLPPVAPAAGDALQAASDALGEAEVTGKAALEKCR